MIYNSENRSITTERLLLRMFKISEAEPVAELCNNYNVYKSTLSLPYPYTLECALSWIANHEENYSSDKFYEFAITNNNTGEIYGCIGLSNNQKDKNGEVGYWIGEQYWRNGFATEALRAVIEFALSKKKYHRVYSRHFASNPASGRVMQKAGMQYEGTLIDHIFKENKYETIIHYGIINPAL